MRLEANICPAFFPCRMTYLNHPHDSYLKSYVCPVLHTIYTTHDLYYTRLILL